jgi:hypothetical protein
MTLRTLTIGGAAAFVILAAALCARPLVYAQAASPFQKVRTSSGILVEEVKVGGSCVVVVSLEAAGARAVDAVPCSR